MRKTANITALCAMLAAAACSTALAESWSSFKDATFAGIGIHPALAASKIEYTVTIDPGATVSFGGNTYAITWIGGFYAKTISPTDYFDAADAVGSNDWSWVQDPTQGPDFHVVGWKASGDGDRIHVSPGAWKKFYFGNFDLGATVVNPGFHLGYLDDKGKSKTDFFSGEIPGGIVGDTPEPSGLLAGMTFLAGLAGAAGRRFRRKA
jgi:hypothetical protein